MDTGLYYYTIHSFCILCSFCYRWFCFKPRLAKYILLLIFSPCFTTVCSYFTSCLTLLYNFKWVFTCLLSSVCISDWFNISILCVMSVHLQHEYSATDVLKCVVFCYSVWIGQRRKNVFLLSAATKSTSQAERLYCHKQLVSPDSAPGTHRKWAAKFEKMEKSKYVSKVLRIDKAKKTVWKVSRK